MWTDDKKLLKQFRDSAARNGFADDAAICAELGVPSVEAIPIGMGAALQKLANSNKQSGSTSTALVLSDTQHRALYQNEVQFQRGQAVRQIARWAETKDYRMTDQEIALVVMRGEAMGLDVFNPHEVQVWKDKHGVSFQLAYTLITQWMNEAKGGHTQPKYSKLSDDEKEERGIDKMSIAIRCEFMMRDDVMLMAQMMNMNIDTTEVQKMFMRTGIGVAPIGEYNGQYFAPNGRSKLWKVQKRAYTDAVRTNFGEPGLPAILKLRQARGEENIQPQDWREVTAGSTPGVALLEAKSNAKWRNREPATGDGETAISELYDLEGPNDEVGADPYDMSYLDEPSVPLEKPEWGKLPEPEPTEEPPPHWSLEPGKYDSFYAWADAELGSREAVVEALKDKEGNERDLIDIAAAPTAQWYVTRALEK